MVCFFSWCSLTQAMRVLRYGTAALFVVLLVLLDMAFLCRLDAVLSDRGLLDAERDDDDRLRCGGAFSASVGVAFVDAGAAGAGSD
mmetsp:Transcript_9242/g.29449  ORF Transcript_9242/g.29449 Transcript_9242/m.29449 type:complete len:86 (-) Transcript_9242:365-622(-)